MREVMRRRDIDLPEFSVQYQSTDFSANSIEQSQLRQRPDEGNRGSKLHEYAHVLYLVNMHGAHSAGDAKTQAHNRDVVAMVRQAVVSTCARHEAEVASEFLQQPPGITAGLQAILRLRRELVLPAKGHGL